MNYLYAGCWLNGAGRGGIHLYRQEKETGDLEHLEVFSEEISAGYLCLSPDGKYLYAVEERKNWHDFILDEKDFGGGILAYSINPENGRLHFLNRISSCGCNPNCLSMTPDGKWLFAVNYGTDFGADKLSLRSVRDRNGDYRLQPIPDETSIVMISVHDDGSLNRIEDMFVFPNEPSHYAELFQWCSHAHAVRVSPDGEAILVAERGGDLVYLFALDKTNKRMVFRAKCSVPRGVGARNVLFHPQKKLAYVIGEVRPFIIVYMYDERTGVLQQLQILSTVEENHVPQYGIQPRDFAGFFKGVLPSDMIYSSCGQYLYVTNRGPNVLTTFKIRGDGLLERLGVVSSGGNWPRTCVVDPDGRFLYVGNQKSNSIDMFMCKENGILSHTEKSTPLERVSHLRMVQY